MEIIDAQAYVFVLPVVFLYLYVEYNYIKIGLMGDIIIVLLVFWVVGKLLKGVFGGFSQSSFKDDK